MMKHNVFQEVPIYKLSEGANILTSTWAMKKKSNGTFISRMNATGFQQIYGEHYDSTSIASPVANEFAIRCMFVLMLRACWMDELLDVKVGFLHGNFKNGEALHGSSSGV
jgi:hypothetical protein